MKTTNEKILESVKELTSQGKSSKQISEELKISERTVKNYRSILKKTEEPKPFEIKPYMHPNCKVDFNLIDGKVIEIVNPPKNKRWLVRAYTSSPIASAVYLCKTPRTNLSYDLPKDTKMFEVVELSVKEYEDVLSN